MRNIKEEVDQFFRILTRECPGIEGKIEYNLTVSHYPANVYDLDITFPSKFRDKVYSLSKFCGLVFTHEYNLHSQELCTFQSDAQFF